MKLSLIGTVKNAKIYLKEIREKLSEVVEDEAKLEEILDELNFESIEATIEGLFDIIVAVCRGQETIEEVKDFCLSEPWVKIEDIKLFETLITFTKKEGGAA